MIICNGCGIGGIAGDKRCRFCQGRIIDRKASYTTPLDGQKDRWATSYTAIHEHDSPHLRRYSPLDTIGVPQTITLPPTSPSTAKLVRSPNLSPFEVRPESPIQILSTKARRPIFFTSRSANILRPTYRSSTKGYYSDQEPIVESPKSLNTCTDCVVNQLQKLPRINDPHLPFKRKLLKDLKRVCLRPGTTIAMGPKESAKENDFTRSNSGQPRRPSGPRAPKISTSATKKVVSVNITSSTLPVKALPALPTLSTEPILIKSDYLPLTSIPRDNTPPLVNSSRISSSTTISYERRWGQRPTSDIRRVLPDVTFDIVPNTTPRSEVARRYLQSVSKNTSAQIRRGQPVALSTIVRVASLRKRYMGPVRIGMEERITSELPKVFGSGGNANNPESAAILRRDTEVTPILTPTRRASNSSTDTFIVKTPETDPHIKELQAKLVEIVLTTKPSQQTGRRPDRCSSTEVPDNIDDTESAPVRTPAPSATSLRSTLARLGGNMPPCPCCHEKIAYFDRNRIEGPHATTWHQSCLACGSAENGRERSSRRDGCGKRLDKGATIDLNGVVWCNRCRLEKKAHMLYIPSISFSLPPMSRLVSIGAPA